MPGERPINYPLVIPASTMPGSPDIDRELLDVFSNPVFSFTSVWQLISTRKHPELAGYESIVYGTVESPDLVMESTARDGVAIFETSGTGPYGRNLRVVVDYDAYSFPEGGTRGKITTAYDRDVRRFPEPQVGKVIYSKKKGRVK